ncbi:ribosome small subunit-dependent GTPase A [Puniceicoccus vermicola]|uniref:Small ribosomal subunit biogenesis GTPase RsgA n=1 Tax=Puniceicoccus vermicola TaxID=388746 RepID=A0A7X1AX83_9BACT|nr:ribosome small subunit-dependent GTPase A [Puniceicoccus vermicola]MBC2601532.1 ribosome small subunit-dependent GTPase A [Puniceicoccus vermicola]
MTLTDLGWNTQLEAEFAEYRENGWEPARLIRDNKISYGAFLGDGEEVEVSLGGSVYHDAETDAELPSVGDWVALEMGAEGYEYDAVIRARLSRRTCLSRKATGKAAAEQVIAANVDRVFVVTDPGQDFNERRMERYFEVIEQSGASPAVILNKVDLHSDEESRIAKQKVEALSPGVPVLLTSAMNESGVDSIRSFLEPGLTIALVGSSGVGKSSIVNQLLGEEWQWVGEVNAATGKGMHTTSARELLCLPGGGMLIDNPGIREVQLWRDAETLKASFSDFDEIAKQCKFRDCGHGADKGCAIQAAIAEGTLSRERFINYLKLDEELERLSHRQKKRQITIGRRNRREQKSKDEKYNRKRGY